MSQQNSDKVTVKQTKTGWVLVHPRSVRERDEDIKEVEAMLEADEIDVARDELRYLVQGCSEHIGIHFMLGDIALAERDYKLARGHYGYAYDIGFKALKKAKFPKPVLQTEPDNELFFEAGKQLAWCLKLLEKDDLMRQVVEFLLSCDKSDPLQLRAFL